ncbi:MAG: hypothetical protein HY980_04515 [Candidatus Magasanikbacteria bacterium]|nr:hypothetical protein [Candidatus Magasanikbacteria bacterium]
MLGNIKKRFVTPAKGRHQYRVGKSKKPADKKRRAYDVPANIFFFGVVLIGEKTDKEKRTGEGE